MLSISALGLGSACRAFHDKDNDFTAITTKLDDAISGQKNAATEHKKLREEITMNVDSWQKENKKLMEELTVLKTKHSDDISGLQAAMQKAAMAAHRELSLAKGNRSLAQRISPEVKTLINTQARMKSRAAGINVAMTSEQEAMAKLLGWDSKALTGLSSPGSLSLQDNLVETVYNLLPEYGIWSTLGTETISARNNLLSVQSTDPIAYVIDEGATIADDTNITGAQVTAAAKKIAVLLKVSNELLMDAEYDITPRIMRSFLRAIAYRLDFLAFVADGTVDATNGGFTGVLNFGTAKVATTTHISMETLTLDDVTGTLMTPGVQALSRASRWWMHPHILVRMLHIKDANGRPIFLTAMEAPTPGALGSILGFPVTVGNVLPSANTINSKMAIFGDPDAFVVGLRKDVEIISSEHFSFNTDQQTYRGIARAAVKGRLATGLAYLKLAAS